MKKHILTFALALLSIPIFSQNLSDLSFGTDTTFEVMTWNLEWFPKNGQTTIDSVAQVIRALDVDLIALQEINNSASFNQLVDSLGEGWDGYVVNSALSGNLNLAYIYKTDVLEVIAIYEIFKFFYEREFPRPPLVIELKFKGEYYIVINNHFKCCGNGSLNQADSWDEETRRYDASQRLKQYIGNNLYNQRVIVLGDLNDILTDNTSNNTFQVFLDDTDNYVFADLGIATGSSSNWSYPGWPSHLDHILMTDEMFSEFNHDSADIETIRIGDYLPGGFSQYDAMISDHRPVALKVFSDTSFVADTTTPPDTIVPPDTTAVYISALDKAPSIVTIFPNPSQGSFLIEISNMEHEGTLCIYDILGKKQKQLKITSAKSQLIHIDMTRYEKGTFLIRLVHGDEQVIKRIVVQ